MKYAFMSFSCPDASLGDALALAQQAGYQGFEPRCGINHRHGIALGMTGQQIDNAKQLEFLPSGQGAYDLPVAMQALVQHRYDGWISGEWINADHLIDLHTELASMRQLEAKA